MNWNLTTALVVATSLGAVTVAKAQPIQYPAIPNCPDTGGSHLNYTASSLLFSCGTSGGGGGGSVTEVDTGTGLTGGPITTSGTISFATVATNTILSNISGGTAAPTPNSMSANLDYALGSTSGMIALRGGSGWGAYVPEHGWTLSWATGVTVTAATYPVVVALRGPSGDASAKVVIDTVDVITAGTSSPGFTAAVVNSGSTLTGCSAISVGTVESQATCTANNTVSLGSAVNVVISNIAGTPDTAGVQVNYHWTY